LLIFFLIKFHCFREYGRGKKGDYPLGTQRPAGEDRKGPGIFQDSLPWDFTLTHAPEPLPKKEPKTRKGPDLIVEIYFIRATIFPESLTALRIDIFSFFQF